jgi:hypothetical protein
MNYRNINFSFEIENGRFYSTLQIDMITHKVVDGKKWQSWDTVHEFSYCGETRQETVSLVYDDSERILAALSEQQFWLHSPEISHHYGTPYQSAEKLFDDGWSLGMMVKGKLWLPSVSKGVDSLMTLFENARHYGVQK